MQHAAAGPGGPSDKALRWDVHRLRYAPASAAIRQPRQASYRPPHQTIRKVVKASAATATSTWTRSIATFSAASTVLAARNPEAMRMTISTALTQWIDPGHGMR